MMPRALTRRYRVLSNKNFRLLLADRALAPASFAFALVGVSFAVLDATRSPAHPAGSTADLAFVLAAQTAPSLVVLLIGGVLADRVAPQFVIVAANVMIAVGEGTFGLLVLTGHARVWNMIALELVTGSGTALFYPASAALLPKLVPAGQLQDASAISRLGMNAATMAGAALAGACVAAFGPGWALTVCGLGMLSTVPLNLAIRLAPPQGSVSTARAGHEAAPSVVRELREGWAEFRSRTWLWVTVLQYTVMLAAWSGAFGVLGPVVAKAHLGGAQAWGLISAAEAVGLIAGGLTVLRWTPRLPVRFVVLSGGAMAFAPLALAMLAPLPVILLTSFVLGVASEMLMVVWTVTMATKIPPDKLARVSAYDALGSVMGMPVGALVAGPIAAAIGVSATQYGAAGAILVASALALISRAVRTTRLSQDEQPGQAAIACSPVNAAHSSL
jgi:MFS family permease